MAVQKMPGAQNALLHRYELFADDVPLLLGIANALECAEKLALGGLDVKSRGAQLGEQPLDVIGFTFAH